MNPRTRYNLLRAGLLVSVSILALAIPIYAASIAAQHTTGHIRILNGTTPGLLVTPSLLDFGNVTWGTTVTKQINVTNTGNCVERINATAIQPGFIPTYLYIPQLFPQHSILVNATYETKTLVPGDYSFGLDWGAMCI